MVQFVNQFTQCTPDDPSWTVLAGHVDRLEKLRVFVCH